MTHYITISGVCYCKPLVDVIADIGKERDKTKLSEMEVMEWFKEKDRFNSIDPQIFREGINLYNSPFYQEKVLKERAQKLRSSSTTSGSSSSKSSSSSSTTSSSSSSGSSSSNSSSSSTQSSPSSSISALADSTSKLFTTNFPSPETPLGSSSIVSTDKERTCKDRLDEDIERSWALSPYNFDEWQQSNGKKQYSFDQCSSRFLAMRLSGKLKAKHEELEKRILESGALNSKSFSDWLTEKGYKYNRKDDRKLENGVVNSKFFLDWQKDKGYKYLEGDVSTMCHNLEMDASLFSLRKIIKMRKPSSRKTFSDWLERHNRNCASRYVNDVYEEWLKEKEQQKIPKSDNPSWWTNDAKENKSELIVTAGVTKYNPHTDKTMSTPMGHKSITSAKDPKYPVLESQRAHSHLIISLYCESKKIAGIMHFINRPKSICKEIIDIQSEMNCKDLPIEITIASKDAAILNNMNNEIVSQSSANTWKLAVVCSSKLAIDSRTGKIYQSQSKQSYQIETHSSSIYKLFCAREKGKDAPLQWQYRSLSL